MAASLKFLRAWGMGGGSGAADEVCDASGEGNADDADKTEDADGSMGR